LIWPDEAACAGLAAALATRPGITDAYIELHGPLGAGKTTFVRHLLRALGVAGRIKSPTFSVMEPYLLPGGDSAAHFDFYRFSDPREWLDAGFRDVFAAPGLKLAEWPEHAGELLPAPDLRLWLEPVDLDSEAATTNAAAADADAAAPPRRVTLHAGTPHGLALLQGLPR
jgi:tRNA threonylcarbamoyladenosine biosynthesis protein TsaE